MLAVTKIKPKMLSNFLTLDSVLKGKIVYKNKSMSIEDLISIFCFERYFLKFLRKFKILTF
jgi:hypothetical protein